ncbi:MAG: phage tail assembly protein [Oligoflexales bacterium]
MEKVNTLKLSYPIDVDGTEVNELKLRNPKVIDLVIARKKSGDDDEIFSNVLAANLAEVSVDAIGELDMATDIPSLIKLMGELLTNESEVDKNKKNHREIKLDLAFPIQRHGKIIDHIIVKRPKYKDWKYAEGSGSDELSQTIRLLHKVTGLEVEVLNELEASDYARARDHINLFLGISQ